jgi:hypothetical protein
MRSVVGSFAVLKDLVTLRNTSCTLETAATRRILDEHWVLTETVGGGGMLQVYRATDLAH